MTFSKKKATGPLLPVLYQRLFLQNGRFIKILISIGIWVSYMTAEPSRWSIRSLQGPVLRTAGCNILICRCMQKHIQHSKDERTQFFRKNIPLTLLKGFERVTKRIIVWEVSWRFNRTATYWPPTLLATAAFLSCSPGLLNRGPGGPASSGIWFSF